MSLEGREILLGVSGGIACYKAVEVLRGLKRAGAEVSVVMTPHAEQFVAPLTFQTLSNRPVGRGLFELDRESRIGHIAMAERAELALVCPCTANVAAKLRAGIADDLLTTVLLATEAPVYLALAMNDRMLANPATRENLEVLERRGTRIIPPETGFLAEGKTALGRLAEPERIVAAVARHFETAPATPGGEIATAGDSLPPGALRGRRVVVTAGPTHEAIDPVRYLSNPSSGRMGFAIAEACRDAGAEVVLVTGPVSLSAPAGMETVRVVDARQMREAVMARSGASHAVICAAAVSDYRPKAASDRKLKREGSGGLTLELEQNPDIAAEVGAAKAPGQVLVIFAAESHDLIAHAQKKLAAKNADLMVANDITETDAGFGTSTNRVTLLRRAAGEAAAPPPEALPLMDKRAVAERIVAEVAALLTR